MAVASLPDGIKDPGEFVETRSKTHPEKLRECFQEEVLDTSKLWNEWYTDRIIARYDPNDSSSFASICDDITTFLSKNPNAADRTKQAYETAGKLAKKLSSNESDGSISLRVQLESDLLGMASKKATKRENLEERKQAVDKLAKATLGSNLESNIPGKLQQSPKQMQVDQRNNIVDSKASKRMNTSDPSVHQSDMLRSKKHLQHRSITQYDKRNDQRPMTPHFSGFQFNPSDADWLGISKKNVSCFVFRFCRIHHL